MLENPAVKDQLARVQQINDAFFCGEKILACPVFDPGAQSVSVLLPECAGGWRLRGAGKQYAGGERLCVPCRPEDDPVWFVRDSLLPKYVVLP